MFRRLLPNASPVKQLENNLQCKIESDVVGRMDLLGGTAGFITELYLAGGLFDQLFYHAAHTSFLVEQLPLAKLRFVRQEGCGYYRVLVCIQSNVCDIMFYDRLLSCRMWL